VIDEAAAQGGRHREERACFGPPPAGEAIGFVLGNPNVHSLIVGGLNLEHIRANVAAVGSSGQTGVRTTHLIQRR
jgi:aryl-alcohol dehydrogenase-like predicted oxidoreductase